MVAPNGVGDTRDFQPAMPGRAGRPPDDLWAIVVGITEYQHRRLRLEYAAADADAFYDVLCSPTGGGFDTEHICKLTDEEATTAAVTRALRSFLKKPARDDLVVLYFACHGAPDPDRPELSYLLTHDTDPFDISGTALPMREIDLSLRENLLADRVVILADTCHSGAISGGRGARSMADPAEVVNRFLEGVSKAQRGVAVLTSAEANEVAREGPEWGGGHGVFTHFLLEGMGGAADRAPRDGKVTVGELFDYVREKVMEATKRKQHPTLGPGMFDRELPLAITAGASAEDAFALGRGLLELGLRVDDRHVLALADAQLTESVRLARSVGGREVECLLQLGLARIAVGDPDSAVRTLGDLAGNAEAPAEASFHLGMAQATSGGDEDGHTTLRRFADRWPDDPRAGYARWAADRLERRREGRRRALLIGAGELAQTPVSALPGVGPDVERMRDVLVGRHRFAPEEVTVLVGPEATRDAIVRTLGGLDGAAEQGPVLVYSTGHSHPDTGDAFLVPFDAVPDEPATMITAAEFDDLLSRIGGDDLLVVLDLNPHAGFVARAERARYSVVLSASPGEQAYEAVWADLPHPSGVFTHPFLDKLDADDGSGALRDLVAAAAAAIAERGFPQTPRLIGEGNRPVFSGGLDPIRLYDFGRSRSAPTDGAEVLERRYARVAAEVPAYPELHLAFGRALVARGADTSAEPALRAALEPSGETSAESRLHLARSQVRRGRLGAAAETLRPLDGRVKDKVMPLLQRPPSRRHAVLVGIDRFGGTVSADEAGRTGDIRRLRELLVTSFGVPADDVAVLLDDDATESAIRAAVQAAMGAEDGGPVLLALASQLSRDAEGRPAVLTADGRPLALEALVDPGDDAAQDVVALIDAASASTSGSGDLPTARGMPAIGQLAVYPGSAHLIRALLARAESLPARAATTYAEWAPDDAVLLGRAGHVAVLADVRTVLEAERALTRVERATLRETRRLLDRHVKLHPDADVHLSRGLIRALLERPDAAIRDFDRALLADEEVLAPAAHFHLGRVLYEKGDVARAVSELQQATSYDPTRPEAWLYLGRALRTLVERQTLAEAETAMRHYLAAGAPAGGEDEALAFLRSRRAGTSD
jgi:tetratricopeptide (TPR) repeat protein